MPQLAKPAHAPTREASTEAETPELHVGELVLADGRRAEIRAPDGCQRAEILGDPEEGPEGALSFRIRLLTGYPVRRYGYIEGRFEEFDEVLSFDGKAHRGERIEAGACPFLDTHSTWSLDSVLGVLSDPALDRKTAALECTVRMSARAEIAWIRDDIRSGVLRNISGGYRVYRYEDVTPAPAAGSDPGARRTRRLLATDWETREGSLVPIGADPTARIRSGPKTPPNRRDQTMDPELESTTPTATATPPPAAPISLRTETPAQALAPAAPAAPTAPASDARQASEALARERERARRIREKLTRAALPLDSALARELLEGIEGRAEPATIEQATERILDELTRRDAAGATRAEFTIVDGEGDKTIRAISDVIESRALAGMLSGEERAKLSQRLQGNPYRFRRLIDLGLGYLESVHGARGLERLHPMHAANVILNTRRESLDYTRDAPGYHVTSDFASLLANVANKGMARQFAHTRETYTQWTGSGTLADFKETSIVSLSDAPRLLHKLEGAEVKFGAISDKGETIKLLTYARGIAISREAIINDDLGAFTKFPMAFGASARQLEADLVYAVLTGNPILSDGVALFHATHGNLVTGVGNSLVNEGVDALDNLQQLARAQQGLPPGNGEEPFYLSVELAHLRVPHQLEIAARQLTTMIQADQVGNVNPFSGVFRSVMAEVRLGVDSAIAFYGMADPSMMDTIEVRHLEGETGPVIETQLGWRTDGVEMKCRHVVGVAATEHRGLYKNEGTD